MGFYNMSTGDAPTFKKLADNYAIADNYHQPVMGGTTVNYLALATGDVTFYTDQGKPAVPPAKMRTLIHSRIPITGTPKTATVAAPIFSAPICATRRCRYTCLSEKTTVSGIQSGQLRAGHLLHGQQYGPGLLATG
jgi:hypothetical protein